MWDRSGGVADDQFGGQFDVQRVEVAAFHEPHHEADRCPASLWQGPAHSGQPRSGGLREVEVVEAGHGYVGRYPQSALGGGGQRTDRDLVVEPDDGGRPVGNGE